MAKVDVYFEVLNDSIIALHWDAIDETALPAGHSIVFANVDEPETLLGLKPEDINTLPENRPVLNVLSEQDVLKSKLRSLVLDKLVAEMLQEDTTALQTQLNDLSTQYSNIRHLNTL